MKEKDKNFISAGAYLHLRKFITEALILTPEESKKYKTFLLKNQKIKEKVVKKESIDNYLREFCKLERKIYQEFDIEKELENFMTHPAQKLTAKETKVLQLLKDGFSYIECSKKLFISESTLKTHVNNIFQKKGVNSLQELIVLEFTGKFKGENIYEIKKEETSNIAYNLLKNLI